MNIKYFQRILFVIGIVHLENNALHYRSYLRPKPPVANHLTRTLLPVHLPIKYHNSGENQKKSPHFTRQSPKFSSFLEKIFPPPMGCFEKLPLEMIVKIAEHTIECTDFHAAIKGFRSFAYLLNARAGINLMDTFHDESQTIKSLREHFVALFFHHFPKVHPCLIYKHLRINISQELRNQLIHERLQKTINEIAHAHKITQQELDEAVNQLLQLEHFLKEDGIPTFSLQGLDYRKQFLLYVHVVTSGIPNAIKNSDFKNLLKLFKIVVLVPSVMKNIKSDNDKYVNEKIEEACILNNYDSYRSLIKVLIQLYLAISSNPTIKIYTPLIDSSIIQLLIDSGAHVDRSQDSIHSTLYHAIQIGDAILVKSLLARGADPKYHYDHFSMLRLAIRKGDDEIVTHLLQAGAMVTEDDIKEEEGYRSRSFYRDDQRILKLLQDSKKKQSSRVKSIISLLKSIPLQLYNFLKTRDLCRSISSIIDKVRKA